MSKQQAFYSSLKPFSCFEEAFDPKHFSPLPADWIIIITDIKGSTAAIAQGHYRAVNAIGVASIVAIFNAVKPIAIPFVFGGDGATLCIPPDCLESVNKALIETSIMAQSRFSLTLRCGLVPYSVVKTSGQQIMVGKCQVTEGYCQAAFMGKGLAYAEDLVKNDPQGRFCLKPDNITPEADFTGFECRWKDVLSPYEETISILVMGLADNLQQANTIYQQVFTKIQEIYGQVDSYRPIQQPYLELSSQPPDLQHEVFIRTANQSRLGQMIYALLLTWKVRLGRYLMAKGLFLFDTDWGKYKASLVTHTDFQKFDENLRMVISGTSEQRKKLTQYLEQQYQHKQLVYGIHVSDRALMTCVISDYNLNHIHFVDGADGGYALAAKALKAQLKNHPTALQTDE